MSKANECPHDPTLSSKESFWQLPQTTLEPLEQDKKDELKKYLMRKGYAITDQDISPHLLVEFGKFDNVHTSERRLFRRCVCPGVSVLNGESSAEHPASDLTSSSWGQVTVPGPA
ncbi:hypothetical protein E2C01_019384 [Portunus trituberculatus]|uniref:Uncharacterized protein n=1 Tax=Portunus trituberculatus TaxID=210409 RepID=A0A5B7DXR6_PORTR|nr:hypothetical protein [Portunus trituberculatus]